MEVPMMLSGKTLVLGIGAQRCGTTWLHDYLSRNPSVYTSPLKEFHFFDTHFGVLNRQNWELLFANRLARQIHRSGSENGLVDALRERLRMHAEPEKYLKYFSKRSGERQFICEITPSYSLLDADQFRWVKDFIASSGARLKIVFLMRDPVDRFRSQVQRHAKRTGTPIDYRRSLSNTQIVSRTRYDRTLENARAVFGEDKIIIGFYENVFSQPDKYLRMITDKIGIEYCVPNIKKKINASPPDAQSLEDEDIRAALSVFAPVYDYVNREFPDLKPASWRA